jgi:hypothetical protein
MSFGQEALLVTGAALAAALRPPTFSDPKETR